MTYGSTSGTDSRGAPPLMEGLMVFERRAGDIAVIEAGRPSLLRADSDCAVLLALA